MGANVLYIFVYMKYLKRHFSVIFTADPDGLIVAIHTYDPHIFSGSTPRVKQWLIME